MSPEDFIKELQLWLGVAADGNPGPKTIAAFEKRTGHRCNPLPGFRGDLSFLHDQEGHNGHPHWPGGKSGITLDPGLDLGQASPDLVRRVLPLYGFRPEADQLVYAYVTLRRRGEAAKSLLEDLSDKNRESMAVSKETALEVMPFTAGPYWESACRILPMGDAPDAVHTAILSLTYNRGPGCLTELVDDFAAQDWAGVGRTIGEMQQDHEVPGVSARRRREGSLILSALETA